MSVVKHTVKGYCKRVAEACPACLINMVQGDVLALTLHHWIVALETGLLTGTFWLVFALTPLRKFEDDKLIFIMLTAIADFIVVPSHFGGHYGEAISTGVTAAIIAVICAYVYKKWRTYGKK